MLRLALLFFAILTIVPAHAADWMHYVNERFGVEADIPPGFAPGVPPVNGDGLRFSTPTSSLAVFGSFLDRAFADEIGRRLGWKADDGWTITYQAVTPGWASFSGRKGSRVLYARAVTLCDGAAIGQFELEYMVADLKAYDPIIDRLVRSLGDSGTGWQC